MLPATLLNGSSAGTNNVADIYPDDLDSNSYNSNLLRCKSRVWQIRTTEIWLHLNL